MCMHSKALAPPNGEYPMRTWPVDFSGFTDDQAITERLGYLQTCVWRGHEDIG